MATLVATTTARITVYNKQESKHDVGRRSNEALYYLYSACKCRSYQPHAAATGGRALFAAIFFTLYLYS